MALNRVKMLARTISRNVRLVRSPLTLVSPRATALATSASGETGRRESRAARPARAAWPPQEKASGPRRDATLGRWWRSSTRPSGSPTSSSPTAGPSTCDRSAPTTTTACSGSSPGCRANRSTSGSSRRSPRPPRAQLDHFTHVDYEHRMALVAELGDEIVAVARYDRTARTRSRPRSRSRCRTTSRAAGSPRSCSSTSPRSRATHGIRRFVAETLPDNRRMLGVFPRRGLQVVPRVRRRRRPRDVRRSSRPMRRRRCRTSASSISEARSVAPAARAPFDRGRSARAGARGRSATRCSATCSRGGFTGPVYPVNPHADLGRPACAPTRRSSTSPTRSTSPSSRVPRRGGRRGRATTCAQKACPRARRHLAPGSRRSAATRGRRARARRARPAARHAPGRARTAWAS